MQLRAFGRVDRNIFVCIDSYVLISATCCFFFFFNNPCLFAVVNNHCSLNFLYFTSSQTLHNCSYFIPEDGDTETNPNVFLAPKSSRPGYPPTLEQVKTAFPLPGRYHFRFKTTLIPGVDKGPVVWMDCIDDSQPVGVFRNSIVAKITRISL